MVDETHEIRISLLEKQSQRIADSLQKLAEDMHRLTGFSIQQAEDRTTLRRAFDQIEVLNKEINQLKDEFDQSEKETLIAKNKEQQKQLDEAKANRHSAISEVLKTSLLMAAAAIAGHFGWKWM